QRSLSFRSGKPFERLFDAVVGADVARELQYGVDREIIISHGSGGAIPGSEHADSPFRIVGVLAKTGTPVDRTILVSLEAYEAVHSPGSYGERTSQTPDLKALQPKAITAALIGLKSKLLLFRLQRYINTYRSEPLLAILPGITLHELWSLVSTAETALLAVSLMVVVTALIGMVTMILATLAERRREVAILRSVGAGPGVVIGLLVSEATILTALGVLAGVVAMYGLLVAFQPVIQMSYGLHLEVSGLSLREWGGLAAIIAGGCLAGLVPALRAYRLSLADGMTVRS
ncbi:MAG TPA: FtsX-like permease family protein, partial [Hyphomicrobiaceae bacterium]|nr:FtsX-like permease family protein [Hyphomicrobiaceae bacterium]